MSGLNSLGFRHAAPIIALPQRDNGVPSDLIVGDQLDQHADAPGIRSPNERIAEHLPRAPMASVTKDGDDGIGITWAGEC